MIARHDLCSGGNRIRVIADQHGDRHGEITDQRGVNEIAKVNDACYAVSVDKRVQPVDIVMDDLRALQFKLRKHLRFEVIENLFDNASTPLVFYVVCSSQQRGCLGEIPE